jgi:hypothetical protein
MDIHARPGSILNLIVVLIMSTNQHRHAILEGSDKILIETGTPPKIRLDQGTTLDELKDVYYLCPQRRALFVFATYEGKLWV